MVPNRIRYFELVELDMVNFDFILGMDWLHTFFATIDCRTRGLNVKFCHEPLLEWKGGCSIRRGRIISFLNTCKMISNGCLYHIVRIKDLDSEIPPFE